MNCRSRVLAADAGTEESTTAESSSSARKTGLFGVWEVLLVRSFNIYRKRWGMGKKDGTLIGQQQKRIFGWSRIITSDNQNW
jgi:hypothetical protein